MITSLQPIDGASRLDFIRFALLDRSVGEGEVGVHTFQVC
jgi:hypothetical protein